MPLNLVPPKPVSVVTINYRTPEITLQCLASIAAANVQNISVTIIDNNSGDNSVSLIDAQIDYIAFRIYRDTEQADKGDAKIRGDELQVSGQRGFQEIREWNRKT